MKKLTGIGGLIALSGMVLLIFKMIASIMSKSFEIADLTLKKVLSPENVEYLDSFSSSIIDTVATTPIYLHLIIIGIILAVIGGFTAK